MKRLSCGGSPTACDERMAMGKACRAPVVPCSTGPGPHSRRRRVHERRRRPGTEWAAFHPAVTRPGVTFFAPNRSTPASKPEIHDRWHPARSLIPSGPPRDTGTVDVMGIGALEGCTQYWCRLFLRISRGAARIAGCRCVHGGREENPGAIQGTASRFHGSVIAA